jgi:LPXTG-motif cell wall-anchored protein
VRFGSRATTIGVVAGLAVLGLAGPALAHVEVSADKTTAGARNVTLTFTGEAESDTAGIASERVVLPDGIAPSGVSLVKAPAGWKLTPSADGFTVGGPALKIGQDAVWQVKIAKLPDGRTRLSFKTLETYGDGKVVRWIEIQQPGQDEPDHPAPLVTLKPAAASGSAPAPASEPVGPTVAATPVAGAPADTGEGTSTWWIWVVLAVVVAAVAGFLLLRRRNSPPAE